MVDCLLVECPACMKEAEALRIFGILFFFSKGVIDDKIERYEAGKALPVGAAAYLIPRKLSDGLVGDVIQSRNPLVLRIFKVDNWNEIGRAHV